MTTALLPAQTAFVFPGQGSQLLGMGRSLAQAYPAAAATFAAADRALGYSLSGLCWEGPEAELNQTLHTQPAVLTHSVAVWRAFLEAHPGFVPRCVAGHSLGEFSALVAAGALEFDAALALVRKRAQLMTRAGETAPGGMAAVLNLDAAIAGEVCREAAHATGEVVVVANDNCPGQIVISGGVAGLERAMALARERGARRAVRLAVSIAAHSPLMKSVAEEFARAVQQAPIVEARIPLVGNTNAAPLTAAGDIQAELSAQLTSPVRWTESVQRMQALGASSFIEMGPKDVLAGLIRRILPEAAALSLGTPEDLAAINSAA
jgi:[acyl-carrier-protein] S-malonyltransferase